MVIFMIGHNEQIIKKTRILILLTVLCIPRYVTVTASDLNSDTWRVRDWWLGTRDVLVYAALDTTYVDKIGREEQLNNP